jgi:hypothetical protein
LKPPEEEKHENDKELEGPNEEEDVNFEQFDFKIPWELPKKQVTMKNEEYQKKYGNSHLQAI